MPPIYKHAYERTEAMLTNLVAGDCNFIWCNVGTI